MNRNIVRLAVVAVIALAVGVAGSAAVLASIPNSGSAPSIFDTFNWSSTSNGFWHVNAYNTSDITKNGQIRLLGNSIELDRRVQTDPFSTTVAIRIEAHSFGKFGFGLGVYHAGTIGMEFDGDGIKCGRGTNFGYRIDPVTVWSTPPTNRWFYLWMNVKNPYPNPTPAEQKKLSKLDAAQLNPVTLTCAAYTANGKLINKIVAKDPEPNTSYPGLDEAYFRTWDSGNDYRVDWFYAGPESGDPLNDIIHS